MGALAVVTGASAGIGEVFARELAAAGGYDLVLVARRLERLNRLAGELRGQGCTVEVLPCDLRRFEERERLIAALERLGRPVELLINNAGYGSLRPFAATDLEWELEMVELNCKAPLHLLRHYLPLMAAAGKGAVVNVASTAAYQPMPYMATYGATKAFLLNLSVALSAEYRGTGVSIQGLCPGPTQSEFHLVVGLEDKLTFLPSMRTERVVRLSLEKLHRTSPVVIPGMGNRFLAGLNRVVSRRFAALLVERVLRGSARQTAGGAETLPR